MPATPDQLATVVISRALRTGHSNDFDGWADRLDAAARGAPGHLASLRLGQTEGLQHLIFRFRTRDGAERWQNDDAFHRLAAEADSFSVGLDQTRQGDPVRFELPSDASAAKWKRFIVTWIAVFPILLAVSSLVRLVLKGLPPVVQLVPSSLLLTAALQWLILPQLQRRSRFWVLKDAQGNLRKG